MGSLIASESRRGSRRASRADNLHFPAVGQGAMKIAAIDIGSNSIHMVTARIGRGGFEILDRAKEMVRLGSGTLMHGRLSAETMEFGFRTLATFKRLAERQGADPILAVATSAVREASNGGEFVLRAWEELGLKIDVITGAEEGRLIFEAVRHAIDLRDHRAVVVDIGGGSIEVMQSSGGRLQWQKSFKLGVTRMTEQFIHSDPPKSSEMSALKSHARRLLFPAFARARRVKPTLMIGTSGTLLSVTGIAETLRAGKAAERLHNHVLRRGDLAKLLELVVDRSEEQRERIPGLDRRRVDLLPAGTVLADVLLKGLRMREMRACEWALREGIILDFMARHSEAVASVERVPDVRRRSIMQMAHRFAADEDHGRQVARLALRLFDLTRSRHDMGAAERELLEFAALVHDVGLYVSHSKHHRHSYYLITHGELRGFLPEEIQIIAAVARFHKGAPPKASSEELTGLSSKGRELATKLMGLLRIADSLDRGHHGIVQDINLVRSNGKIELVLDTDGEDAELELWAAGVKSELWVKSFGNAPGFSIAGQARRA
ncbi:MAG TPA: Ppx/GppA phosphatase family protein [Candidatus Binataceae bacterium]|nr:Ppx/GppA phosphatase family protein [Candidatus Binataceae bacterium]